MDLLADDRQCLNQRFPRRVDVGRLREERKERLKRCAFGLCHRGRQAQTIHVRRSCSAVAKLNQVLRRCPQAFTLTMQGEDGTCGDRIMHVRSVGQASQDARFHEVCHQSYKPSLLTASCGRETPQLVPTVSSIRSQSSGGCGGTEGVGPDGTNFSRRASTIRLSGVVPRRCACSATACSMSGVSVIVTAGRLPLPACPVFAIPSLTTSPLSCSVPSCIILPNTVPFSAPKQGFR